MSQKLLVYQDNELLQNLDISVMQNFRVLDKVGKGAYGVVWKGIERRSGRQVAIKKILNAFRNRSDAQRTYREITLLRYFRHHPNIITLLGVYRAINDQDIYLVFEFMPMDLHHAITTGTLMNYTQIKFIMFQLLNATKFIHSCNIIHRDQKPSNILLDSLYRCKLADFGLARFVNETKIEAKLHQPLTEYVATRWYRAPEILLGCPNYNKEVDMWSLGCILSEMVLWRPIFPGKSTLDQIAKICTSISANFKKDFPYSKYKINQMIVPSAFYDPKKSLKVILKDIPYDAFDLIRNLLVINPNKRFTASHCLNHKFVSRYSYQKNQIEMNSKIELKRPKWIIKNDESTLMHMKQLSVDEYKQKLYKSTMNCKIKEFSEYRRSNTSFIPQLKNSNINIRTVIRQN